MTTKRYSRVPKANVVFGPKGFTVAPTYGASVFAGMSNYSVWLRKSRKSHWYMVHVVTGVVADTGDTYRAIYPPAEIVYNGDSLLKAETAYARFLLELKT